MHNPIEDKDDTDLRRYDMYRDIEEKLAKEQGDKYSGGFMNGLPLGLELPNGVVIGA